jgi:hypothetical protein
MKFKLLLLVVGFIPAMVMAEAPKIEVSLKIEASILPEVPSPFKTKGDGGITVSPPRGNVDQIPDVIVNQGRGDASLVEVHNGDVLGGATYHFDSHGKLEPRKY